MSDTVEVGKGFVRLDGYLADDLSVINSARVSFGRRSDALEDADIGLIKFLMRERHGTPFEHNSFRFHIKCPIFVAREWFRHRIGSFNEFSARYSEVPNEFFVPEPEEVRTQVGKPGAYRFEQVSEGDAVHAIGLIETVNTLAYASYEAMIAKGVAKELARVVLPVGMYTQFYWTVNARSLMNFLSLRTHDTAQYDIRKYANAVHQLAAPIMPVTFSAWEENSRVAP